MRSRIESIGTCLPGGKAFIKKGSVDYAVAAGKKCLENSNYMPSEVQMVINAGVFRDGHYLEPAMAVFVQDRLGINTDFHGLKTFSFDVLNSGCGMLNAIEIINRMMATGTVRIGMVVSSEVNPDSKPDSSYAYRESGAALIIDRSPHNHIGFGSFLFKTFESYQTYYDTVFAIREKNGRAYVRKSAELERAYLDCIPAAAAEILKKEKLAMDDIDLVLSSQISHSFLDGLAAKLNVPESRIVNILDTAKGDTHTTSMFLSFDHALKNNILKPGQKVLMLSVGAGITVGGTVYYS
jgi:3-oxoacyl-[acyl-carrier-protein] synthase III